VAVVPQECDGSHITFVLKGRSDLEVDLCHADSGSTTISILGDDAAQSIYMYNGPGLLGNVALHGDDDYLSLEYFSGGNIFMGAGNDYLYLWGSEVNRVSMKAGNDVVTFYFSAIDVLKTGDGNDHFESYYGLLNVLDAGDGDDSAYYVSELDSVDDSGVVTLNFGLGDDYASLYHGYEFTYYTELKINFGDGSDYAEVDGPLNSFSGGCISIDFGTNGQDDELYVQLYYENPTADFCNIGCSHVVPGNGPCFEIRYNSSEIYDMGD